jgi:hypothetical protein
MPLIRDLLELPAERSIASRYTALNGVLYLGAGALFTVWPGAVQTIFRDSAFVGHEGALFRAIGMILMVVGLLYLFGGRSGARQVVAASVIDRVTFVPVVLLLLAAAGAFPHTFVALAILEPALGIGAWVLLSRKP